MRLLGTFFKVDFQTSKKAASYGGKAVKARQHNPLTKGFSLIGQAAKQANIATQKGKS